MKQKLMMKCFFISTLLVAAALCLLGLPLEGVKAGPPDPTPSPALDIRTKLQPYQRPGVEPSGFDGRLLEEVPPLSGVKAGPPAPTPSPALDIRTKLQPHQRPGVEPSGSDGRLLKKAPPSSEVEESPIGALAQQTFYATADATVIQGYPTQNLGNTIDMWAGYDDFLNPDGRIVRSLVKFNIASLPANQDITRATLRVRLISSWDFPGRSRTVRTYRITSNWTQGSVTWNNKPGYGGSYGSKSIRNDDFTWHEFDVTNLVAAWYIGTYTNHGVMLRGPEISGFNSSWRGFSTREGPYRPQLVVEYEPPPPQVNSITPSSGPNDRVVQITNLAGSNFRTGATVKLTKAGQADINATNVVVVSASKITGDLDLTSAATGAWNVVVTNPDGQSGTLPGGFTITLPPPRVDSITPDSGPNDRVVQITNLAGSNFQTGATVKLTKAGQADINATNVVVVSASKITCDLDLTGAAPEAWDVVVTNPDGQSGTLPGGFNVIPEPPPLDVYLYLPIILNNAGSP